MILTDTGPLVALFDRADPSHYDCVTVLKSLRENLATTVAVLTEAFHMLQPESRGSAELQEYAAKGGLKMLYLERSALVRTFELMQQYADLPMDFSDATLVSMAERLGTQKVFTLDHNDFSIYRIKKGYRHVPFEIIG